jgi:hypothetical protein
MVSRAARGTGKRWRVAFVDADPVLVERTRASLEGGPFSLLDLSAPPAPGEADLQLAAAGSLGRAGARAAPRAVPLIAYGPASLLRSAYLAGCVDYLRDPWTAEELSLRALAALGRLPAAHVFPWGVLRMEGCMLEGPGGRAELTAPEERILKELLASRGEAVPREALALCAWGCPARPGSRALDARVSAVRRKIRAAFPGAGGRFIASVRGEGYRVP